MCTAKIKKLERSPFMPAKLLQPKPKTETLGEPNTILASAPRTAQDRTILG